MPCIFCDIIDRKKPAKIFFDDTDLIVIADILPRAAIHLLVIPRLHVTTLMDLPDELLLKMIARIRLMAKELSVEDNFRVILNNGAKAGQIIDHLHFHFLSNADRHVTYR